jgi:hypothetical protein
MTQSKYDGILSFLIIVQIRIFAIQTLITIKYSRMKSNKFTKYLFIAVLLFEG